MYNDVHNCGSREMAVRQNSLVVRLIFPSGQIM